jgi:hypothetical protein
MSENWTAIAAEIEAAIASVGFAATLEEPGTATGPSYDPTIGAPTLHAVTVIDDMIKKRDAGGMVTGSARVLTMKGNGTVPLKGWRVQVRGQWHRIAQVWPLAPGGTDLLFDVELEG